ncbi:tryptophan halogenase family protein, partial [Bowmanella denitrificans]
KLIVVGGGTAGWMAACAVAKQLPYLDVTLLESPAIPPVGVGEGSTPHFKRFMTLLGIDESVWMPACGATYKNGIFFRNWNGKQDQYFHPFYCKEDVKTAEVFFYLANQRRRGMPIDVDICDYFITGHLARQHKAPVSQQKAINTEYGYHFSADRLATFLKSIAIGLGVTHKLGMVDRVTLVPEGDEVASLILQDGQRLEADLFIDASGFQSILLGKALKVPFIPFSDQLLTNRAVTLATKQTPPFTFTDSIAMNAGWRWRIPLQDRIGNGYVYADAFISPEQAEQELIGELGENVVDGSIRHLSFTAGMRQKTWVGNVLGIGLAQSFVEPLEATSLMVTQLCVEFFIHHMNSQDGTLQDKQQQLNQQINGLLAGIKDYIVCHYAASQRTDTKFWQQASHVDKGPVLIDIMHTWRNGQDVDEVLYTKDKELAYFRPSWYAILNGMDYHAENTATPGDVLPMNLLNQAIHYSQRLCEENFISQDKLLHEFTRAG